MIYNKGDQFRVNREIRVCGKLSIQKLVNYYFIKRFGNRIEKLIPFKKYSTTRTPNIYT